MITAQQFGNAIFGRSTIRERQGTAGTEIFAGYLSNEDHNTEWDDNRRSENVEKMLLSDALIKASSYSFLLPILAGEFSIEPASEQPIDLEIAEFVEKNYFENPNFNWNDIIWQVLQYLYFGFTIMSKQLAPNPKVSDGKWWLTRFEYMKPDTWEQMFPDADGDLGYIKQFAYDWQTQQVGKFRIDAENLFLIVNDRRGRNYKGVSLLRPIWSNFKIKQLLVKIEAAEHERYGIGLPKGILNNSQKKDDLVAALESVRAHEKSYLVQTPDYEIDILKHQVDTSSIIASIARHNMEINTVFQRTFMALGEKGGGSASYALAETMEGPFYDSVGVIVNHVERVFNSGMEKMSHVQQLVDENYSNVKEYPKLRIRPKSIRNLLKMLNTLPQLATVGLIDTSEEVQDAIHDQLELPKRDRTASIRKQSSGMPPNIDTKNLQQIVMDAKGVLAQKGDREKRLDHSFLAMEKKVLSVAKLEKTFDKAHADLKSETQATITKLEKELTEAGMRIFTSSQDINQLVKKLDAFEAPLRGKFAEIVTKNAQQMFDFGRNEVKEELDRQEIKAQKVTPAIVEDQKEAFRSIRQTVKLKVADFFTKIMSEWKRSVTGMFKSARFSTDDLQDAVRSVSQSKFTHDIGSTLNEALGLGRNSELLKISEKEDVIFFRSEVLDQSTCAPCINIDGQEFTKDDPFFSRVSNGPFSGCEGRELCRGINFAVKR